VPRILGISGSLRRDSHNTNLLRAAAEVAGPDVELELYDGLKEVPPYDEDDDVHLRPSSVARLNAAIADADAVLFSTPEYNSSIPGQLKNAVDWISRPIATNALRNKPVAVVGIGCCACKYLRNPTLPVFSVGSCLKSCRAGADCRPGTRSYGHTRRSCAASRSISRRRRD